MQYWMSTAKPSFLQELEKRNLELKSKIDRTWQVEEKPTFNFLNQKETPQMNFWQPVSQKWVTNFQDYKETLPKATTQQPTTQKSSGFSIIQKANAMEEQDLLQQYLQDDNQDNESKQQLFQALQDWVEPDELINYLQSNWYTWQTQPKQDINDMWLLEEWWQRLSNLWTKLWERAWRIWEDFTRERSKNPFIAWWQNLLAWIWSAWEIIWWIWDIAFEWLAYATPDIVKEWLYATWRWIKNITPETIKKWLVETWKTIWQEYKEFKKDSPFLARWVEWTWNIATALPIVKWWKIAWKWVEKTWEALVKWWEKIADTSATIWKTLETKWQSFRNALSWLDEREITALKNTPKEEFEAMLEQGKKAIWDDYAQTPYHEWAKKANEAFKQLETILETNQKARVETLKNSWIEKIETWKVREDIVKDIENTFNIQWVKIVDWKPVYKVTPWRKSLLDDGNIKDYEALKLLEDVTKSKTPLEMMDTIKRMQNLIYDSSILNRTGGDMYNLVERSIWKLNQTFKEQVWWDYAKILDDMARDIKLKADLDETFKAWLDEVWNRWELAMKRLAKWTTTSSDVRNLALKIKEITWIDLIKEARLRQLVMDLVWDKRWADLFWIIKEWPSWIISKALQKWIEMTPFSKEKTALARTQKILPNKWKNANTTNNTSSNTTNKKTTWDTTPKYPLVPSLTNDMSVKNTTTQKSIPEVKKKVTETKQLPTKAKTQLETTLKWVNSNNIDEVSKTLAKQLNTPKIKEIKEVITKYIKEFWEDIKNKLWDLIDEISEKVWWKINLLPTKKWNVVGVDDVKVSDDLIEQVWKHTEWFKEWKLFDISPQSKSKISKMEIKADNWEITKTDIDSLNKWFKDNKDNYIKLYHWTSPQWNILDEWLKATSSKTARSLQSWKWYVYLSFDPARAKTFWEMAYAWKTPKVYEIKVKIWDLLADTDQLWNKRYWGENQNIWNTLADSLLYWKWFRVKWNIEPYKISEYNQSKTLPKKWNVVWVDDKWLVRLNPMSTNKYVSWDFKPLTDLDSDDLFRAIWTKDWENIPKEVTLYRWIKENKDFWLYDWDFLTKNKKIAENFAWKNGKVKAFKVKTSDLQWSDFWYEEVIYKPVKKEWTAMSKVLPKSDDLVKFEWWEYIKKWDKYYKRFTWMFWDNKWKIIEKEVVNPWTIKELDLFQTKWMKAVDELRNKQLEDFKQRQINRTKEKELDIKDLTITNTKLPTNILYHWTSSKVLPNILKEWFKTWWELWENAFRWWWHWAIQNSISLSLNPKIASNFTWTWNKWALITVKVKDNAKIVKIKEVEWEYAEYLNDIIPDLKKKWVDAIYIWWEDELVVINKNIIEIKWSKEFNVWKANEELKQIYEQAKKTK